MFLSCDLIEAARERKTKYQKQASKRMRRRIIQHKTNYLIDLLHQKYRLYIYIYSLIQMD